MQTDIVSAHSRAYAVSLGHKKTLAFFSFDTCARTHTPTHKHTHTHTQRVGMLKSAAIVGTMKSKYAQEFGDPVGKVYDLCCVLCGVLLDAQCKSSVSCGV
jgi:hypothetical protein